MRGRRPNAFYTRVLPTCIGLLFCALLQAAPTNQITWAAKDKTLSANLAGLPLEKVLSRIAALTKWQVYVEPGLSQNVAAKFQSIPTAEALRLLLGDMNYALVPGTPRKLYIYRNSVQAATQAVAAEAKAKNWIANEILLTVSPESKENIDELAKALNAKIVGRSAELHAYRLQFDTADQAQAARDKLASRDDMEANDNFRFETPDKTEAREVASSSAFPIRPKDNPSGQITVALIDTPVQALDGKMKDFILPSLHVAGDAAPDASQPTHATSMAETILNSLALASKEGQSSPVRVLPIDVYGGNPSTTTFEVGKGLYAAIQEKPAVINMSLGGGGDSPFVEYLLEIAKENKILVFAAAGNEPTTEPTYPAASPNVIGVTASDWRGNLASYANRGDFVDVKAPGTSLIRFNDQTYVSTGTSTATAFVSGQAAALQAQGMSPDQTAQAILQNFNVNRAPRK